MPVVTKKSKKSPVAHQRVSEQTARARKELALAEQRELEVAILKGQWIKASEVKMQWLGIASRITTALEAFPATAAPRVIAARDARHAEIILREEIEAVRRQVGGDLASRT